MIKVMPVIPKELKVSSVLVGIAKKTIGATK
jgi:hypothetical protein